MGYTTKALHARYSKADTHGALRYPIYQNAAFEFETAEDLEAVFKGRKAGHNYTRSSNPSIEEFEGKVRNITGALGVVSVATGMAAISTALLAVLKSGDNIVTTNKLFSHTLSLFQTTFDDFGIKCKFVDLQDDSKIEEAIDENTKVIFFETISNPELLIPNIKKLSEISKKHGIVLAADTTMTPFYLFDSKKHGVNIELISGTKYISGGGTALGGLIIDNGNFDWSKFSNTQKFYKTFGPMALLAKLRKQTYRNLGASLSPQNAYMLSLGLETLALRADKSAANTLELAKFLSTHEKVKSVNYPDLESSLLHERAKEYFLNSGSVFTFDVEDKKTAYELMNKLKLARRATNIHDTKTLVIAPYDTIFVDYNDEEKKVFGLRAGTIRVSVGIEDIEDLIEDFKQALS